MAYIPRVGILIGHHAFDLSILYSRRDVNHLFLLILKSPGNEVEIQLEFSMKSLTFSCFSKPIFCSKVAQ